ncbi:SART-1 protein [Phyllosticta citribraziliensis]|uniref:SART-1 protein n=1 Tax=Phyllosticta citribraziliensis TaxID=989973 RepID=A0ABR1M8I5_9PEZI
MADAISIEEANKIRVAMGMKPLPVPGQEAPSGPVFQESKGSDSDEEPASTLETRTEASYGNWSKHLAEQEARAKANARKEAIKKAREQAQRFAQLEGKGLGDGDDVDAKTWLAGQKKRQKKIEKLKKLEQELAEREAQAQAEYTALDLAGVKVGHELDQFGEGEEHILTLKDTAVDDEEGGDELEAVNIRDAEKVNERLESKKRKRTYDPNNLDDTTQGAILAQYDEEIDGKKRKLFTLDGQGRTKEEAERNTAGDASGPSRSIKISLDLLKDESTPASDYVDPSQVKVKKPKKKKEKKSRKKALDDDDIFPAPEVPDAVAMDVDQPESKSAPKKTFDDNFVDDEDLQAQLALQRRQALKKRKKVKPEDLARQIREEASATPGVLDSTETPEEEPGLVIDETTEFIANLQGPADRPQSQRSKSAQPPRQGSEPNEIDDEGDTNMEQSYAEVEDEAERQARAGSASAVADMTTTGLDDEEIVERGVGATLRLLRQRGQVKDSNGQELNENFVGHQRFIAERNKAMVEAEQRAKLQRERDRRSGRMEHMSAREREALAQKANQDRDRIESKRMAEIFNKEYKPNVDLKYVDEHGRHMNAKEAFKHLSHQFHGKGSGKQKTEKRLKKIEEEKKREAMSSLDSSQHTSMNTAMDATARKNRAAGIRLE